MAKALIGIVTSDKPAKTVVVSIVTRKTHPLYKKQYSETAKFMVHDENNEAKLGDKVSFVESRPISARKRHVLKKVIERPMIDESTLNKQLEDASESIKEVTQKPAKPAEVPKPKAAKKTAPKKKAVQEEDE